MSSDETRPAFRPSTAYTPLTDGVRVAIKLHEASEGPLLRVDRSLYEGIADILSVMGANGDLRKDGDASNPVLSDTLGNFELSFDGARGVASIGCKTTRYIPDDDRQSEALEVITLAETPIGNVEVNITQEPDGSRDRQSRDLSQLFRQMYREYDKYHDEHELQLLSEYGERVQFAEGIEGLRLRLTGGSATSLYLPRDPLYMSQFGDGNSWWVNDQGGKALFYRSQQQSPMERAMENLRKKGLSPTSPFNGAETRGELILFTDPVDNVRRAILNIDDLQSTHEPQLSIDDLKDLALLGPRFPHRVRDVAFGGVFGHVYTTDRNGSNWSIHIDKEAARLALQKPL